jgi:hypothetical protein
MIKALEITNHSGDSIQLDLYHPEKTGLAVKSISGLEPPKSDINTSDSLSDGSFYNSSRLNKRNIIINLLFVESQDGESIESLRHKAYKYFPLKRKIDITVKTDYRIVRSSGYVESNEPDIFSSQEGTQISIICPDAYWYDLYEKSAVYAQTMKKFTFPFAIGYGGVPLGVRYASEYITLQNNGDETGLTITISGISETGGITSNFTIYNADSGAYMRIKNDIQSGDIITITTHRGNKACTLIRDGKETNLIGNLYATEWLTAASGENNFFLNASSGIRNVEVTFTLSEAYAGV